jgi:hypothetical protein
MGFLSIVILVSACVNYGADTPEDLFMQLEKGIRSENLSAVRSVCNSDIEAEVFQSFFGRMQHFDAQAYYVIYNTDKGPYPATIDYTYVDSEGHSGASPRSRFVQSFLVFNSTKEDRVVIVDMKKSNGWKIYRIYGFMDFDSDYLIPEEYRIEWGNTSGVVFFDRRADQRQVVGAQIMDDDAVICSHSLIDYPDMTRNSTIVWLDCNLSKYISYEDRNLVRVVEKTGPLLLKISLDMSDGSREHGILYLRHFSSPGI